MKHMEGNKNLEVDWESINLSNNFVFFKVMQDEDNLSELIKRILPDIQFKNLEITAQKEIQSGFDIHGVRLDIFAIDENDRAITIEMQVQNRDFIPKRLRYYSSVSDNMMLEKNKLYRNLPDTYVIIICCFDLYGKGLHKYTFSNKCDEVTGLEMGDGVQYIILNTKSKSNDVDINLRNFLDYVDGKITENDGYIRELDKAVKKARLNKEWRREYMTIEQINLENQEIGKKIGKESIIISMLDRGSSSDEISKLTGLSYDYISEIQNRRLSLYEANNI